MLSAGMGRSYPISGGTLLVIPAIVRRRLPALWFQLNLQLDCLELEYEYGQTI